MDKTFIPRRTTIMKQRTQQKEMNKAKVDSWRKNGLSVEEMAKRLGVSAGAIYKYMRELDGRVCQYF